MTLEMPNHIVSGQNGYNPKSIGVSRAAVIGSFVLLRVGDLGGARLMGASLHTDSEWGGRYD